MAYEEVTFQRDTHAIQVPDGITMVVPEGTAGIVMQVLGGNFTLRIATGHMVRLAGADADAIGKDPAEFVKTIEVDESGAGGGPGGLTPEKVEKIVWEQLATCYDPEIPVNIVELGLIYGVTLAQTPSGAQKVQVDMTLTAPGCGMGQVLIDDVESKVSQVPGVEATEVEMVFDPPWTPDRMSEAARLELGL